MKYLNKTRGCLLWELGCEQSVKRFFHPRNLLPSMQGFVSIVTPAVDLNVDLARLQKRPLVFEKCGKYESFVCETWFPFKKETLMKNSSRCRTKHLMQYKVLIKDWKCATFSQKSQGFLRFWCSHKWISVLFRFHLHGFSFPWSHFFLIFQTLQDYNV